MPFISKNRDEFKIAHVMKLLKRFIERDGSGYVKIIPEDDEDIWNIYNMIHIGDQIEASTLRRVQTETASGSMDSERVRITLTISVETVGVDLVGQIIHVKGKTIKEHQHVKMGSYHTIDLELNWPLILAKAEWDTVSLDLLQLSTQIQNKAEIAAIILQEGMANVCLLTESTTRIIQNIQVHIPKKRKGMNTTIDKAMEKFYNQIFTSIQRNLKLDLLKAIIVASPGFLKDDLFEFLCKEANRTDWKLFTENKSKFVLVHSATGHLHSLQDALRDPTIQSKISSTKYARQSKALADFYSILSNDPGKAYYGYTHVFKAAERGAVKTLMIADDLFRSTDVTIRKQYIALVETVKDLGGEVFVFSSLHGSGQQLAQLTGVAAILTYAVPEIEDE